MPLSLLCDPLLLGMGTSIMTDVLLSETVRKIILLFDSIYQLGMASQLGIVVCVHFSFSVLGPHMVQNFTGAVYVGSLLHAIP